MPEKPFDRIQESMKFVGAVSFDGDAICFGPNETRPLPGGGSPLRSASDSDDSGKAVVVEGDTDVSGVAGKELMSVASSSSSASSSSTVAETHFSSGSSSQHDEADDTTDEDAMDEDTTDVPEAMPMLMRRLAIAPRNEFDPHLYWSNREPRLFEDTPEQADISSGLGNYECVRLMALPEESQHDADPHQVHDIMPSPPIVTFQVPGFSMGLSGGIVPFAEWQSVEDPDDVGLENLDIFMNP